MQVISNLTWEYLGQHNHFMFYDEDIFLSANCNDESMKSMSDPCGKQRIRRERTAIFLYYNFRLLFSIR